MSSNSLKQNTNLDEEEIHSYIETRQTDYQFFLYLSLNLDIGHFGDIVYISVNYRFVTQVL